MLCQKRFVIYTIACSQCKMHKNCVVSIYLNAEIFLMLLENPVAISVESSNLFEIKHKNIKKKKKRNLSCSALSP